LILFAKYRLKEIFLDFKYSLKISNSLLSCVKLSKLSSKQEDRSTSFNALESSIFIGSTDRSSISKIILSSLIKTKSSCDGFKDLSTTKISPVFAPYLELPSYLK
jgi:hypothetical protein